MTPETQARLESLVKTHLSKIREPFTLEEILSQVESADYNAEMMLQHLLLWVSNVVVDHESKRLRDIIFRAMARFSDYGPDCDAGADMFNILSEAGKRKQ